EADASHAAAFDRVQRSYEQAGLLRRSSAGSAPSAATARKMPDRTPRYAMAAAIALVALVPAGFLLLDGRPALFGRANTIMLMTNIGEIRQVELSDGSKVTLDTDTRIEVAIDRSHRLARLNRGRARFEVAAARSPFVIEEGATTVATRQGVIDVERAGPEDGVQVLAGSADVRTTHEGGTSDLVLGPGERAGTPYAGQTQKSPPPAGQDWTRGMLQFDGTPLADAVALANRYSERHILLAGDLDAVRVTGAFRAGDTAGFAKALAAAFGLSLQQDGDGNLILSRNMFQRPSNKRGG
ncbi:MAG TPA: FecR domain-containing protein, partial [Sphingomicrobium sp.]|nr:FecR domain-containing protein [Sphingomicrobium sp.]